MQEILYINTLTEFKLLHIKKFNAIFYEQGGSMVDEKTVLTEVNRQMELIRRGVAEIIPEEELAQKLFRSIKEKRPLRAKLGLDPTAPDIHLGHTVVLNKLRQFQDLGHEVHLIIGDFTGRIGDPSGKSETRKQLSEEEVMANAATYQEQIFKILDREKTFIHFNSSWLMQLKLADVLNLAGKYTVARMLERDDFSKRYREGLPIGIHEFMYPLMQAYDSVELRADVELGGTDQKFNLLVGRNLLREYGQEPQVALTMPILEGTDGVQKMSKSLGNYIGVNEEAYEMFGKTMSIPDELIARYFELLTRVPMNDIQGLQEDMNSGKLNPRDAKIRLAKEIIKIYHNEEEAEKAEEKFRLVFSQRDIPEDIPVITSSEREVWLPKFLHDNSMVNSTSDGRRMIKQGAVKVNGEKYQEENLLLQDTMVLQVGRRKFCRLRLS
ncbi:tyrosyl-tRNA synthetase [Syntrophomonas wolfei subsp. wolfei str. Goettingen G311]|uniref:Tyrosine--tRNA ligase n=2 Tax=Syntrophomonas wolfei TaxID=863 RepID=Q0AXY4_SYNWW|nr:tyrosyl-tRNA synthetase [Syntrophomonas wolfei subsp. wolfei str. Goettingen G311]